jgi:hypothetical protein
MQNIQGIKTIMKKLTKLLKTFAKASNLFIAGAVVLTLVVLYYSVTLKDGSLIGQGGPVWYSQRGVMREGAIMREGFGLDDLADVGKNIAKIGDFVKEIPNEISGIANDIKGVANTVDDAVKKSANAVTDSVDSVKDEVTGGIKTIENTTVKIAGEIDDKLMKFLKEVERVTTEIVIGKITSFFKQLADIFNDGIIKPFKTLFYGIGNIFFTLFQILKMTADKIASLPKCILPYMFNGILDLIAGINRKIMPAFIRNITWKIYQPTVGRVVDYAADMTGYTAAMNRCYAFDVNSKVDDMDHELNKISSAFENGFGKMDFTKIKL